MIVVVGVSHKTAPIAVRERLAIRSDELPGLLAELANHTSIGEVFIISTCNRVEVYATTARKDDSGTEAAATIEQALGRQAGPTVAPILHKYLFRYLGDAAVRHLFRVAASLDSLVVGEAQVLGQVKEAFEAASEAKTLGPLLGRAVEWSFHVAKRVRSETHVGEGSVSVSSVAVELAKQIFGTLDRRVVTLLGAGTMGEAAAQHLVAAGARLIVVNRDPARAQSVAARFDATPRGWNQLDESLVEADVVIASTGSTTYVLTHEVLGSLRKKRRGRSLFVIDIAVPRNVDPRINEVDGVYLYDIDDLSKIAGESIRDRFREAQVSEQIVAEEADAFDAWLDSLDVKPTIVALRNQVRSVLESELNHSLHHKLKHLGPQERKALEGMVAAAVKKLTHHPTMRLKSAASEGGARTLVAALQELFDLDPEPPEGTGSCESEPPRAASPSSSEEDLPPSKAPMEPDDRGARSDPQGVHPEEAP